MRIGVAGGTGLVGRQVVSLLELAGHEPVVLARSRGVDLTTGAGLDAALAGSATASQAEAAVEAVIDVSNVSTLSRRRSVRFFEAATSQLLAAGARAGVRHHVALSIVGIDRVGLGYYAGKLRQEELIGAGRVPWTVLRATQFHEFADQLLARSPGPLVLVPRMRVQPVAAREVAARLVELALQPAAGREPDLAGPEVRELTDLVRQVARVRGRRGLVAGVRVPGGSAAAHGGLLPTGDYSKGSQTFAEWLRSGGPSGTSPAS